MKNGWRKGEKGGEMSTQTKVGKEKVGHSPFMKDLYLRFIYIDVSSVLVLHLCFLPSCNFISFAFYPIYSFSALKKKKTKEKEVR